MQRYKKVLLLVALALVFIIPALIAVTNAHRTKANADGTRTFTFTNNTSQTIWAGALANSGLTTPGNGGWAMAPGSTTTLTVADTWGGRFWGRTYCNFNSAGAGSCETGDCGAVLQCNGAGGNPPATLAEFTLGGSTNKDFYDVSFVDGFNVPMTITPVGGAQPVAGNPYWCGVAGCGTDLNTNCPSALRQVDSSGRTVACKSACEAFNTDQYCCRGAYATPATCNPAQWPVNYAAYFKSNCPNSYSYAYDDPTSTFTDQNANYAITFGPAGGGTAPAPTTAPAPAPTTAPAPAPTTAPAPVTGSGFTQSVTSLNSSQARVSFKPSGWTAGYVIVHYKFANDPQQNMDMTYNSADSSWEYTISGLSIETNIVYSFTYQENGLQYDTGSYSYTF